MTDSATHEFAELARYAAAAVPDRPVLVPWIEVLEHEDGGLGLRGPETVYHLRHPLLVETFRAIAPDLTDGATVDALVDRAPPEIRRTTVVFLLQVLKTLGVLVESRALEGPELDNPATRPRRVFLSQFSDEPGAVDRRLRGARVMIAGTPALADAITELLAAGGCCPAPVEAGVGAPEPDAVALAVDQGRPDLLVACSDTAGAVWFRELNELLMDRAAPWLHVAIVGRSALLGPLVVAGETACYACLEVRIGANIPVSYGMSPRLEARRGALGSFAPFAAAVGAAAAQEAARFVSGYAPPATIGHCAVIAAESPDSTLHAVLRVPGCATCAHVSGARDYA